MLYPHLPILVVDDDPAVLAMLGTALRRAGYQPTLVGTVPAALLALATTVYAAVLTDYAVTSQTGSLVIAQARQLAPTPVIILMSGHSRESLADRLVGLPMTAFLPKPFDLTTLYALLDQCRPAIAAWRMDQAAGSDRSGTPYA
jgi:DNA-binding response OmpR family regulator